jgi:hypothetical protein
MSGERILVCDDDPQILRSTAQRSAGRTRRSSI